jgi:glycosyltransferase involved in cell wall biosynthesis
LREFARCKLGPRPGKARLLILGDSVFGPATVQVRGTRYRELFLNHGWVARFVDLRRVSEADAVRLARQADMVYFLRCPSWDLYAQIGAVSPAKLVFDFNDALWRPPHAEVWKGLDKILARVDAVFSLTEYDTAYAQQFNNLVIPIPVCTVVEQFDAARAKLHPRTDDRVVLGWVGSYGTFSALQKIRDGLESLGERFPQVELRVVGAEDAFSPRLQKLRCTTRPRYDDLSMIEEILRMDVGLHPPPEDLEDYRIRGPQKSLLYMTGRVPPVCVAAGSWTGLVQDGVTGVVVPPAGGWAEKLEPLVSSRALRAEIGRKAYEFVRERYTLEVVFQILEDALLRVLRSPSGRTDAA